MKSYFSILFLLLFACVALRAQPLRKSSREANMEAAEAAMKEKNYYQAVTLPVTTAACCAKTSRTRTSICGSSMVVPSK